MEVMTLRIVVSTILVESSLPPNPVSQETKSTCSCSKYTNDNAVIYSKNVLFNKCFSDKEYILGNASIMNDLSIR